MTARKGHIVFVANGDWPDTRQFCDFACKLLALRPLYATVLVHADALERARDEISSELALSGEDLDGSLQSRVRLVGIPLPKVSHGDAQGVDAGFVDAFGRLAMGQPVQCPTTGARYDAVSAPSVVIGVLPQFTAEFMNTIKARSPQPVKLIAWFTSAPSIAFFMYGPEDRGCMRALRDRLHIVENLVRQGSKSEADEEIGQTIRYLSERLIRIPGYEPLNSWEMQPQEVPLADKAREQWAMIYEALLVCDGIMTPTPESYDSLSTIGCKAWMADTKRGAYFVGPIVSRGPQAVEAELARTDGCARIRDFVSSILKSHGSQSMVYISFGVNQWPKYEEKLAAFLGVLMERNHPFIIAHPSIATISNELRSKITNYKLGLLSSWCPQQMILNHPVTGWFVTACGHLSVMEAIDAGVPMICWPFLLHESFNAMHLSERIKVGYELIQVRTGHGLRRIYRTGVTPTGTLEAIEEEARSVLTLAFGPDGARKREKLQHIREEFCAAWSQTGDSRRSAEELLTDIGL